VLIDFIEFLEKVLDVTVIKNMLPMRTAVVHQTFAHTSCLERDYNYKSQITVDKGIEQFVLWYKCFYKNNF
jgi:UDP-glucuronate 4-epimerase